jgi:hypothetical protein
MLTKKIIIICYISLSLNLLFVPSYNKAMAWVDIGNLAVNAVPAVANPIIAGSGAATVGTTATTAGSSTLGTGGIFTQIGSTLAKFAKDNLAGIAFMAVKIAALKVVQVATQKIIGTGGGGGVITDWNDYLYVAPKQAAMLQMKSFFNTASKGRSSTLNYEGVSTVNYDAYLISQAQQTIDGQPFKTDLQSIVTDPKQIFASGNMKGIMRYMDCGNNPACYTMAAQSKYASELSKASTVAKSSQKDGILPVKKDGKIIQPAALVASALYQVDQQGERLIMDAKADTWEQVAGASKQIVAGALLSVASRSLNYALADSKGKAAAQNKNDSYPFSVSYSSTATGGGQLNVRAGNTISSTNSSTQPAGGATLDNLGTNLQNIGINSINIGTAAICASAPRNAGAKTFKSGGRTYDCSSFVRIN